VTIIRLPGKLRIARPKWSNQPGQELRAAPSTIMGMANLLTPEMTSERTKLGVALYLRDQVYRSRVEPTRAGLTWSDLTAEYACTVYKQTYGHECQGRTYLYLAALKAFGIDARCVGMWEETTALTSSSVTHSVVDVKIGGQFVGMDVHFNHSIKNAAGQRISYEQAQGILGAGGQVLLDHDGFAPLPNLTLQHYLDFVYLKTLPDMMRYIAVGISSGVTTASIYAMQGGWNGILNYADGSSTDARVMMQGPVYQSLVL
jgi:hypothetical protein